MCGNPDIRINKRVSTCCEEAGQGCTIWNACTRRTLGSRANQAYLWKRLRAETKAALKASSVLAISAHVELATRYARLLTGER